MVCKVCEYFCEYAKYALGVNRDFQLYLSKYLCFTINDNVERTSLISTTLREDHIEPIGNLSILMIKKQCTESVYKRANIFKVKKSNLISTNVNRSTNSIVGEFRAALIYEQSICWEYSDIESPFTLETIRVFCTCKYYNKETIQHGRCCKHIIGQLRRVLYLS